VCLVDSAFIIIFNFFLLSLSLTYSLVQFFEIFYSVLNIFENPSDDLHTHTLTVKKLKLSLPVQFGSQIFCIFSVVFSRDDVSVVFFDSLYRVIFCHTW
jgi:hypothetical protein